MNIEEISKRLKEEKCPDEIKSRLLQIPEKEKAHSRGYKLGLMIPSALVFTVIALVGLLFLNFPITQNDPDSDIQENYTLLDYEVQAKDLKLVLGYVGKALIEESSRSGQMIYQKTASPIKKIHAKHQKNYRKQPENIMIRNF